MADFYQNGIVTTLHNLRARPVDALEKELEHFAKKRPLGLILPSLYSELEAPALGNIVKELQKVSYLNQIVVGLDRASPAEYQHALRFFERLPQHHR